VQEHVKFPGEKQEDSSNPGGNAEHAGGSCEQKQQQQKEQEPKLQQQLPRWQDGPAPASHVSRFVGIFATWGPGAHPPAPMNTTLTTHIVAVCALATCYLTVYFLQAHAICHIHTMTAPHLHSEAGAGCTLCPGIWAVVLQ